MEPIKKFNRFELKYLLSIKQVGELKKDLEKYIMKSKKLIIRVY